MAVQVLLGLTAWALVFGPMLLLWWLPGGRQSARERRAAASREVG